MEHYINKSVLEAEIRKRLLPVVRDKHYDEWEEGQDSERIAILDIIDTLEVKEVDEEAMKNVVLETRVMKDSDGDGIDTPYEEWLTLEDTEIPFIPDNIGLKDGDKVKVIIIKQ